MSAREVRAEDVIVRGGRDVADHLGLSQQCHGAATGVNVQPAANSLAAAGAPKGEVQGDQRVSEGRRGTVCIESPPPKPLPPPSPPCATLAAIRLPETVRAEPKSFSIPPPSPLPPASPPLPIGRDHVPPPRPADPPDLPRYLVAREVLSVTVSVVARVPDCATDAQPALVSRPGRGCRRQPGCP